MGDGLSGESGRPICPQCPAKHCSFESMVCQAAFYALKPALLVPPNWQPLETSRTSDLEVEAQEKSDLHSWHTSKSENGTQSGITSPFASATRTAAIS